MPLGRLRGGALEAPEAIKKRILIFGVSRVSLGGPRGLIWMLKIRMLKIRDRTCHNELMTLCGVSLRQLTDALKESAEKKQALRDRSRSPRR